MTDHDSVSGFPEARAAAQAAGVPFLCAIEINTAYRDNVHLLGFGFRETDAFKARLSEFRGRRVERIRRIVERIRALGLALEFDDVKAASHETLGRPHVADALKRKGLVGGRQEAFDRFLAKGKPGYVESMGPSVEEAIALVREAGGFCVLAHPDTVPDREAEIARWKGLGLEGLEVYYGAHSPSDLVRYRRLADDLGLLATGGSDFHGPGTGREKALGVELPDDCYGRFMERLARCS